MSRVGLIPKEERAEEDMPEKTLFSIPAKPEAAKAKPAAKKKEAVKKNEAVEIDSLDAEEVIGEEANDA